jgi:hypothetical protein
VEEPFSFQAVQSWIKADAGPDTPMAREREKVKSQGSRQGAHPAGPGEHQAPFDQHRQILVLVCELRRLRRSVRIGMSDEAAQANAAIPNGNATGGL